ncbi:glutathione hydrolase 1 proenzyme-like isoform X2 [Dreissena polymorpha]|uniref:glutathione hydrolase 1 proenzyme-like isoform X2 n=1 Tax=Dreissena polymorpha TaxID=45954 RepID=UPI002264AB20|nr:glutathione hydrolase 1 proenzyme-like isoform X2 [Dreissena polymorpha]
MGKGRNISKSRAWVIVTVLTCAAIIGIGLGLGLGLKKVAESGSAKGEETTTVTPTSPSPLYSPPSPSPEGKYRFAAVAADNAECSKIGNHIMAVQGGSAVDAAIAAILCVGVHNMHSCGIGGGHFLTYYKRTSGKTYALVSREQAPAMATEDMFTSGKNASSTAGGKAIAIPGEVRGLYEAWKLGGRLPWKQLFQPAIKLCMQGFNVSKALSENMAGREVEFKNFTLFVQLITNPKTGKTYKEGETIKLPKLAQTLQVIADEGPNAFYNGSLTDNIVADIQEAGGIITKQDLANYTSLVGDALNFTLHGNYTAYSPPMPSSGAVYLFILNILNDFKFNPDTVSNVGSATTTWHRVTEAFKHAYSLRTQLGDNNVGSEAFRTYVAKLVKNMTDPSFGYARRQQINDSRTFGSDYYNPIFDSPWNDYGTAHLSVLGPDGDAVSITSTVNLQFGSKVIGNRTGIIFNNEMDDFSTPGTVNYFGVPASKANFIAPWKRPLSSMCPSIVVDGDGNVRLVIGASGGTRITTTTALATIEALQWNWSIKEAIDYPRIHHQLFPQELSVQRGFPQTARASVQ